MDSVNSHDGVFVVQPGLTPSVQGNRCDRPRKNGVVSTRLNESLGPEALLRSQYYDSVGRRYHLNGEFRLLLALLTDAVICYVRYAKARDPEQHRLFNEAQHWFHGRNQRGLFAFETVCDLLGLEPDAVRKSLKLVSAARLKLRRHSGRLAAGPLYGWRNDAQDATQGS
jgi:hypothetical protein